MPAPVQLARLRKVRRDTSRREGLRGSVAGIATSSHEYPDIGANRAASGAKFPCAPDEVKGILTRRRLAPLLVDPEPGDGRRAISDSAAQDAASHVSQVWLEEDEVRAVGHPHPQD